jgi:hypothetical protein
VPFLRVVQEAERAGKLSSDPATLATQLTSLRAFTVQQAELYRGTLAPTAAPGTATRPTAKAKPAGRGLPVPTGGGSRRTASRPANGELSEIDRLLGTKPLI